MRSGFGVLSACEERELAVICRPRASCPRPRRSPDAEAAWLRLDRVSTTTSTPCRSPPARRLSSAGRRLAALAEAHQPDPARADVGCPVPGRGADWPRSPTSNFGRDPRCWLLEWGNMRRGLLPVLSSRATCYDFGEPRADRGGIAGPVEIVNLRCFVAAPRPPMTGGTSNAGGPCERIRCSRPGRGVIAAGGGEQLNPPGGGPAWPTVPIRWQPDEWRRAGGPQGELPGWVRARRGGYLQVVYRGGLIRDNRAEIRAVATPPGPGPLWADARNSLAAGNHLNRHPRARAERWPATRAGLHVLRPLVLRLSDVTTPLFALRPNGVMPRIPLTSPLSPGAVPVFRFVRGACSGFPQRGRLRRRGGIGAGSDGGGVLDRRWACAAPVLRRRIGRRSGGGRGVAGSGRRT